MKTKKNFVWIITGIKNKKQAQLCVKLKREQGYKAKILTHNGKYRVEYSK